MAVIQALAPAPPGPECHTDNPELCLQHLNVCYARPGAEAARCARSAPSLARSLTQLLPRLTSLRTTNFIRYSFRKDTCHLAACPDYTAKEREGERGRR